MNRIWSAGLCAILAGCATCREHPVACKVGGMLVVGAVAVAAMEHNGQGSGLAYDPVRRTDYLWDAVGLILNSLESLRALNMTLG